MANGAAYKAFKTEWQTALPYEIKKIIIANKVAVKIQMELQKEITSQTD